MASKSELLTAALHEVLGGSAEVLAVRLKEVTLTVKAGNLSGVMNVLRDDPRLRFGQLIDLCGVDYLTYGSPADSGADHAHAQAASQGARDEGRFAVVYHLLSIANNWRLRVRTFAPEGELPVVDSVIGIWPSANWFEREAFDLFGIVFTGHPDLRRILTDYGFIGNPFRKDFPISGNVEMRYDPDQQRVIYQPVTIEPREVTPRIVREENYADTEGFRKG